VETSGCGIEGEVVGYKVKLGSRRWLESQGIEVTGVTPTSGSVSYVSINGHCRGVFILRNTFRPQIRQLLGQLKDDYEIALLSGDNETERARLQDLFGNEAHLLFNQSPIEKLAFIRSLQQAGKTVMMVGD